MMTKDFNTLHYDIVQMLKGQHNEADGHRELHTDTAKKIVTLAKNVATHTLDMVYEKPRSVKDSWDRSIRMSELGEPCHRKLMFKWYRPQMGMPPHSEAPEPFLPVKFTFGDYIEELTLFLASEAGHKVHSRQEELTLSPSTTSWYAIGHIDAVIDDTVVDVKSAADVSFNKYKREGLTEETDTFGYLWQLDAYAVARSTDKRAFIFTNKHDGNIHIIDRTGEPLLPVDAMIAKIGAESDDYGASGVLPDKMPVKATKYGSQLNTVCSYCNFKWACYSGDIEGVIKSGRPAYFVKSTLTPEGHKFVSEPTPITPPKAYLPF